MCKDRQDVAGVPRARSTRMRLHDDSSIVTWSAAVSLSFTAQTGHTLDARVRRRRWRSLATCREDDLLRIVAIKSMHIMMGALWEWYDREPPKLLYFIPFKTWLRKRRHLEHLKDWENVERLTAVLDSAREVPESS